MFRSVPQSLSYPNTGIILFVSPNRAHALLSLLLATACHRLLHFAEVFLYFTYPLFVHVFISMVTKEKLVP